MPLLFNVFEDWNEESVPHIIIIIIINIFIQQKQYKYSDKHNDTNEVVWVMSSNVVPCIIGKEEEEEEVEKADSTIFICGSPALLQSTNWNVE